MKKKVAKEVNLGNVSISDGFFSPKQNLILEEVIPYQEKILNDEIKGVEKAMRLLISELQRFLQRRKGAEYQVIRK